VALAAPPLGHSQSFFAPEPLDLLVIDNPTFATGIVVGGPESAPGMVFGVLAQPCPQGSIRIVGGLGDGLVSLCGAMLPGHAAGEPFADTHDALQVTNGCPPALRA
jgi:hypothetical protein